MRDFVPVRSMGGRKVRSLFEWVRDIFSKMDECRSGYNRSAGAGAGGGARDGPGDDGGEKRFPTPPGELDPQFTRGNSPRQRNRPRARAQERTRRSVRRAA